MMRKSGTKALGDEERETDPHGGARKTVIDLQREEVMSGTLGSTPAQAATTVSTSAIHPPHGLGISSPIQHEKFLRSPSQMKTDLTKRDMTKYCNFHRDHGHRIDNCIQLKKEIEFLIRRGHLRRYVAPKDRNRAPPPPPRQPALLSISNL